MIKFTTIIKLALLTTSAALLFACGTASDNSTTQIVDSAGKHPVNYVDRHWEDYKKQSGKTVSKIVHAVTGTASANDCRSCHGINLDGGNVKVSCFTADRDGRSCHAGTPGDTNSFGHPAGWGSPASEKFHGKATFNGKSIKTSVTLSSDCGGCHATKAGVTGKAKSCFSSLCHATSLPTNPDGCDSCHSYPPKTAAHTNLATLTNIYCSMCHSGAGTGTSNHSNGKVDIKYTVVHPAGWKTAGSVFFHSKGSFNGKPITGSTTIAADCGVCHSTNSKTGGAAASCLTSGCHTASPAVSSSGCVSCHSKPPVSSTHPVIASSDCNLCHTEAGTGTSNHSNGKVDIKYSVLHPTGWGSPASSDFHSKQKFNGKDVTGSTTLATDCGVCHSVNSSSGGSTPTTCLKCHVSSPAAKPSGCGSCHGGTPSGPAGTVKPDRKFSHDKHTAAPLSLACSDCHGATSGSGTTNHQNSITNISISQSFKSKTITSTFGYNSANSSCSGISFHGGKQTPAWSSTTSIANNCDSCHEQGTAQYNSYYTNANLGHQSHISRFIVCNDCHNLTTLNSQHYNNVKTLTSGTVFVNPAATIGGGATRVIKYENSNCTNRCHPTYKWFY